MVWGVLGRNAATRSPDPRPSHAVSRPPTLPAVRVRPSSSRPSRRTRCDGRWRGVPWWRGETPAGRSSSARRGTRSRPACWRRRAPRGAPAASGCRPIATAPARRRRSAPLTTARGVVVGEVQAALLLKPALERRDARAPDASGDGDQAGASASGKRTTEADVLELLIAGYSRWLCRVTTQPEGESRRGLRRIPRLGTLPTWRHPCGRRQPWPDPIHTYAWRAGSTARQARRRQA